jgi:quercetin dioxygenase-like cupin family protein
MAKAGDELINLVTGLRTVFRKTARNTDGDLLQVDWIGSPGWTTGPEHVHPLQEERFEVLSGKLGLRVDDVERVHGAGEVIVAAAGSAHAAWNASSDDEVLVQQGGSLQEPAAAGARPAPLRGGDLLRPAPAGRPEGHLRGAGQDRTPARVSGGILLPYARRSEASRMEA